MRKNGCKHFNTSNNSLKNDSKKNDPHLGCKQPAGVRRGVDSVVQSVPGLATRPASTELVILCGPLQPRLPQPLRYPAQAQQEALLQPPGHLLQVVQISEEAPELPIRGVETQPSQGGCGGAVEDLRGVRERAGVQGAAGGAETAACEEPPAPLLVPHQVVQGIVEGEPGGGGGEGGRVGWGFGAVRGDQGPHREGMGSDEFFRQGGWPVWPLWDSLC